MHVVEQSTLDKCQELTGYTFSNLHLLELALTHSSVAPTRVQSNERLEFLGDSVLGLVVCDYLYQNCQSLLEGEMTKVKSAVVSRQTCSVVAEEIGLGDLLLLGKGMTRSGALPQSISAAVLESLIGAIFLDGGLQAAADFIMRNIRSHIDEALANEHQRNFKSLLQQHAQREWSSTPIYRLLDEKGPDHSKCFEVAVSVGGQNFISAWGKNKKEAEQEAARRALVELGLIDEQIHQ
ncbi:MAG: ribonuclease III [Planctomycetes bacterium]|nr:ribonuclease III [Planctomycetota bacterium]